MPMTESLATTAAQTIPVFALAAVVEAQAWGRAGRPAPEPGQAPPPTNGRKLPKAFVKVVMISVWSFVGLINIVAEWECLKYLRGDHYSTSGADGLVVFAMIASLVLLVAIPVVTVRAKAQWRLMKAGYEQAEVFAEMIEDALSRRTNRRHRDDES